MSSASGTTGCAVDEANNCLSYWYPKLKLAGLPVPDTRIVPAPHDLDNLLDGNLPVGWGGFVKDLKDKALVVGGGWPVFLRTGYGSGKHLWRQTCYVENVDLIDKHVQALVEWSHSVDIMGLPTGVWAVRQMIPTEPLFHAFWGMPITREFRVFATTSDVGWRYVDHFQPYWPPDAIQRPTRDDWRERLEKASLLSTRERGKLASLAASAVEAVGGGAWSVDFLQDVHGEWWLTDMADGAQSFRWDPED